MAGTSAGRRSANFERLKANLRAQRSACWLCGLPINYAEKYPHPDAFVVDHVVPWIKDETLREDPANLKPAHARCNASRGTKDPPLGMGNRSEEW